MNRIARRLLALPVRKPCTARLAAERLEDRTVPTGLPSTLYVGSGPGDAPVVSIFDGQTQQLLAAVPVGDPAFTGGVREATADLTGDGIPDVIAAYGPGGEPRVQVFDGATLQPVAGPLGSILAFESTFAGGVTVAAADVDGDGIPDVIAGAGPEAGRGCRCSAGRPGT